MHVGYLRRFRLIALSWLVVAAQPVQAAYPENPLLIDDSIYVSQQGIYKFDHNRREPLWSSLIGVETFEPVIHETLLLVGSTQGLYALELDGGGVVWHIENQHTLFTPSVSGQAYAGSLHGELYAIDPGQGRIIWRSQFPGWIYSPAVNEPGTNLWTGGQAHRIVALSSTDGSLQHEFQTTQELVFSPINIGNNRVAVNLFDGSSLVINTGTFKIDAVLQGDSQPIDLYRYENTVYRSHRDGSLSAFDGHELAFSWRKSLTEIDLTMHPAQAGFLLLSDRGRNFILFDLTRNRIACRLQAVGQGRLPFQVDFDKIGLFQKTMQPPSLTLVQPQAQCK